MPNQIKINSISEISIAAQQFLNLCKSNKLFAFTGEMGVGKTSFIKAICKLLNVTDNVTSPTFSIVNQYKTLSGEIIYHFDFYRIKTIEEAYDIGYEEYFFSGNYCFIEWPEKIEELLPADLLYAEIKKEGETRNIIF